MSTLLCHSLIGYFRYPDCVPCSCDMHGSLGLSCDQTTGQCVCKSNFMGEKCHECAPGTVLIIFESISSIGLIRL